MTIQVNSAILTYSFIYTYKEFVEIYVGKHHTPSIYNMLSSIYGNVWNIHTNTRYVLYICMQMNIVCGTWSFKLFFIPLSDINISIKFNLGYLHQSIYYMNMPMSCFVLAINWCMPLHGTQKHTEMKYMCCWKQNQTCLLDANAPHNWDFVT